MTTLTTLVAGYCPYCKQETEWSVEPTEPRWESLLGPAERFTCTRCNKIEHRLTMPA